VGCADRKRREQERVDETEDDGVGADADGEQQDQDEAEEFFPSDLPDAEVDVSPHLHVLCRRTHCMLA
jgi:hypothetical protein